MDAAIDVARDEGAADMSLGTGEDDVAARALYESRASATANRTEP
jgi:hypothetical protein